jgi:hypothetical protein
MAATISTGGKWPAKGGSAPLGTVLIIQAEDGVKDTLGPRLVAAGANRKKVKLLEATKTKSEDKGDGQRPFSLADDLSKLGELLREFEDVQLIIIDPITAYMGRKINSNDNAQVRAVLDPLASFAEEDRVAILAVTHMNKVNGDAIKRIIGSGAFTAVARINYMVIPDKINPARRLMLPIGSNLGSDDKGFAFGFATKDVGLIRPSSCIVWEKDFIGDNADDLLQSEETPEETHAKGNAVEFLKEELKGGPLSHGEIMKRAKEAGIKERTLDRAKAKLKVKSVQISDCWLWQLPASVKS